MSKLPPLPDEAFDGERYTTELKPTRCPHKNVKYVHGELRCSCGAAWSGPNLASLYAAFTKSA